jgi:hypothetical protein
MKFVATFLVAVFVVAGTSFAFGDCPGHNKAQLVKSQPQEQMSQPQDQVSKEQPAGAQMTLAEKLTEAEKAAVKPPAPEKK